DLANIDRNSVVINFNNLGFVNMKNSKCLVIIFLLFIQNIFSMDCGYKKNPAFNNSFEILLDALRCQGLDLSYSDKSKFIDGIKSYFKEGKIKNILFDLTKRYVVIISASNKCILIFSRLSEDYSFTLSQLIYDSNKDYSENISSVCISQHAFYLIVCYENGYCMIFKNNGESFVAEIFFYLNKLFINGISDFLFYVSSSGFLGRYLILGCNNGDIIISSFKNGSFKKSYLEINKIINYASDFKNNFPGNTVNTRYVYKHSRNAVMSISCFNNGDFVFVSGDGFINCWNYDGKDAKCIKKVDLRQFLEKNRKNCSDTTFFSCGDKWKFIGSTIKDKCLFFELINLEESEIFDNSFRKISVPIR
ncbi:hypothetical protein ACFLYH_02195, partial [Candidatus Dependentiae bacterium]